MADKVDVFERYYASARLDKDNPFYDMKKQNYLLAREQYFSDETRLNSLPIRATIQTTDFCNLNCIMCQIHSQREKHALKQMKQSDFDEVVQKLFPTLMEVHPTNIGEPLFSPWFDYLCNKCKEYGVLLDITSNGTLLTQEKIRAIMPCLLDIKISFDGAQKETFERIRKGADFGRLLQNIDNFVHIRNETGSSATISLQMTLFNFNYRELPNLIQLAKEKGVDRVKAYHVFSYSDEIDHLSLINNPEKFEETRVKSLELAQKLKMQVSIAEPPSKNPEADEKTLVRQNCRLPWAECFIDHDGSVYPCHTHNHVPFGNILSQRAYQMWNSDYAQSLRGHLISGHCENTICQNCGNNFVRINRHQAVPYNKDDYLFKKTGDANINWGKRCKQFLLNR